MKKGKGKSFFGAPQDEPDLAGFISKVQQQLSTMEKKLDILIGQSSKRPFEKSYSQRPPQRFDRSQRHDRGRQGGGHREKTYTKVICSDCNKECEIPFKPSEDRPVFCSDCFAIRNKDHSYSPNQNNRAEGRDFSRGRRYDNRQGEKRQKPFKEKQPFFARRKKRS